MEGITSISGPRREFHAGYTVIEVLAELLASGFRSAWQWTAAALRERGMKNVRTELHGLSDHALRDIGLHRSQIDSLFR